MSVAKVIELSSTSTVSFDAAIKEGIERAAKTVKNVKGAWVKEMKVGVKDGKIATYNVNLSVTFVLS